MIQNGHGKRDDAEEVAGAAAEAYVMSDGLSVLSGVLIVPLASC